MTAVISPAQPRDNDIVDARVTIARHRRLRYPHRRNCTWCREQWPCRQRRAAEAVLRTAGQWQEPAPAHRHA